VKVNAQIRQVNGFSAHADREEMLRWLKGFHAAPRQTYLVHGEPPAATSLAQAIHQELGWDARVAEDGMTVPLSSV
jgi:metallo-beta-lactamase family protein